MIDKDAIRQRWEAVGSKLDERGRRMFAAGEVLTAGWGGLEAVAAITGLARSTIGRGRKDLAAAPPPKGRVRRQGGGRRLRGYSGSGPDPRDPQPLSSVLASLMKARGWIPWAP